MGKINEINEGDKDFERENKTINFKKLKNSKEE